MLSLADTGVQVFVSLETTVHVFESVDTGVQVFSSSGTGVQFSPIITPFAVIVAVPITLPTPA